MPDRQGTDEVILGFNYGNGQGGLGSSNSKTGLPEHGFPSSPVLKGQIPGWIEYKSKVMRGTGDIVNSGQDFQFTTFNGSVPSRTFVENNPPIFEEVKTGDGGLPASAWTPNTASPSRESTNPQDLPNPPISPTAEDALAGYGVGVGGTRDPAASSAVQEIVSSYVPGKWNPSS